MALNEKGHEVLDPTPIARPVRFNRQGSTLDEIRQAIGILNREAAERGVETFEESDDFDVGEDMDPLTKWEIAADAAYLTPAQLMEAVGVQQPFLTNPPPDKQGVAPANPVPDAPEGHVAKPQPSTPEGKL
ncbi:MAG: hypothetical protein [Arizlama microvirus]|nr:MAG: hypothetical protein [Arizlama microvirus]